jgi:hypothetical protein
MYCGDNCNHTGPHRYPPRYETFTANDGEVSIRAAEAAPLDVERLRPLFAELEEADMANRVGKGDKAANLHRLIVAEQTIDAALRSPDTETAGEAG